MTGSSRRAPPFSRSSRKKGGDHLGVAAGFGALDLTPAAVQVADDVAHVLIGRQDLDLHDRLEQAGPTLLPQFAEGGAGRNLEGQDRGVHVMEATVVEGRLEVDDREAGKKAVLLGGLDALLHAGDVLLRH